MPILNWPPAKGPKPPHLTVIKKSVDIPVVRQKDFSFIMPEPFAAERRALLETVAAHHPIDDRDVKRRPKDDDFIGITHDEGAPKKKGRRLKRESDFALAHRVVDVGMLGLEQAHRLLHGLGKSRHLLERELPEKALSIEITYPLSRGSQITIKPFTIVERYGDGRILEATVMSVGYVMWAVAQEYFRIYKDWKKYGIWGHAIEDLAFEALRIRRNGHAEIKVGSW